MLLHPNHILPVEVIELFLLRLQRPQHLTLYHLIPLLLQLPNLQPQLLQFRNFPIRIHTASVRYGVPCHDVGVLVHVLDVSR